MIIASGTVVDGRYTLQSQLDSGGMGTVWVARDSLSGQRVAVKFLRQSNASDEATGRFRREAKALLKLKHPNVVELLGHGVANGAPFIAMELLQGESLRSRQKRRPGLPPPDAISLLEQAAAGLSAAHALGIVHRDVKPSNLVVSSGAGWNRLKLIDFGIASGEVISTRNKKLTFGTIGTPAYMSPEQAAGKSVDHLADVWSLSVVAFELLTGRLPFVGASMPETLDLIRSGMVPLASAAASGVPAGLDAVFQRAFAARRSQRFPNAPALVAELSRVYAGATSFAAAVPAVSAALPSIGRDTQTATLVPTPLVRYADDDHRVIWYENVQLVVSRTWPSREALRRILSELEMLASHVSRQVGLLVVLKSEVQAPDAREQSAIQQAFLGVTRTAVAAYVVEGTGNSGAAVSSLLAMLRQAINFPLETFGESSSGARWLTAELASRSGQSPAAGRLSQIAHDLRSHSQVFGAV